MTLTKDEIDGWKFKGWSDSDTAPHDGSRFLGRIKGTNRSLDIRWKADCNSFWNDNYGRIEISQWITYIDFADIRACVWGGMK